MILRPSSPMLCLEYNPKDPHTLAGGCYNGQLALFDTRKGCQPLKVTPVEISHKDPLHKLIFPSSKTGQLMAVHAVSGKDFYTLNCLLLTSPDYTATPLSKSKTL